MGDGRGLEPSILEAEIKSQQRHLIVVNGGHWEDEVQNQEQIDER